MKFFRFTPRAVAPAARTSQRRTARIFAASVVLLIACAIAQGATITVTSSASGSVAGQCTLQDAVAAANTNTAVNACTAGSAGLDTIVFAAGVTSITLSAKAPGCSFGLAVTEDLAIDGGAVAGGGVPKVSIQRSSAAGTPDFGIIGASLYNCGTSASVKLALTLSGVSIGNANNPINNGGGVAADILSVRDSVISGNTAANGGGIYAYSSLAMSSSTVSGNSGGGIQADAPASISRSTISHNDRGGINGSGPITIDNSTISGNTNGSGIDTGSIAAYFVTVTGNSGPGIVLEVSYINNAVAEFDDSLIVGNAGSAPFLHDLETSASRPITGTYNYFGSVSAVGLNDLDAGVRIPSCANLNLGPLANNGGGTQTHALLAGSCLIDAGGIVSPGGFLFASDQRGSAYPRFVNAHADIGAFESQGTPLATSATTLTSSANPSSSGQAVIFTARVSGTAGMPTGAATFLDGATAIGTGTLDASGVAMLSIASLAIGSHPITAQYAGDGVYAGSTSNLVNQAVNAVLLPSSTQLTASATSAAPGQAITYTARVSGGAAATGATAAATDSHTAIGNAAPGGSVTFRDGVTAIGSSTLDAGGTALLTLASLTPGTHSINAVYAGSAIYDGSTSNNVVVTIAAVTVAAAVPAPAMSPAAQPALALCCLLAGALVSRRRGLSMSRRRISLFVVAPLFLVGTPPAHADEVSPAARTMIAAIDALDVEHHWPAGVHVHWQSGEPDGKPESAAGKHTHCSAFVAAAARRFGIYILRPPEHAQTLLANAQFDWLAAEGVRRGWRPLRDAAEAQAQANQGLFVVATYKNHHDDKPGHIAIVRPGTKSPAALASEGPDITQAGGRNYRSTALAQGFAGHPAAWREHELRFYAHALESPR